MSAKTILVITDNTASLAPLEEHLRHSGYTVPLVSEAGIALKEAARLHPDLIIWT